MAPKHAKAKTVPGIVATLRALLLGDGSGRRSHSRSALLSEAAPGALKQGRFQLERLEPRLLLAANPVTLALPAGAATAGNYTLKLATKSAWTEPTLNSGSGVQSVAQGAIVGVQAGHDAAKGSTGTDNNVYAYKPSTTASLDLGTQDYSDDATWQLLDLPHVQLIDTSTGDAATQTDGTKADVELGYGVNQINLTDGSADTITIDASAVDFARALNISITGNGADSIAGPNVDTAWNVSGANAGSATLANGLGLTETISFSGIAGVTGNDAVDTVSATGNGFNWAVGGSGKVTLRGITFTQVDELLGSAGDTYDASGYPVKATDSTVITPGVVVNLVNGYATGFDSISGFDHVTGSAGDDTLAAGTVATTLLGGAGDDVLVMGSANDSIDGGTGSNILAATGDADFILTNTQLTSGAVTSSFANIQGASLTGGAGNNLLDAHDFSLGGATLDGNADTGPGGNDTLLGGSGNDLLVTEGGNDSLVGNAGDDTLESARNGRLTLTNTTLVLNTYANAAVDSTSLASLEHARLTSTGDAGDNVVIDAHGFSAGSVTIIGGDGSDTMLGSDTQATSFTVGTGTDSIVGGATGGNLLIASDFHRLVLTDTRLDKGAGTNQVYDIAIAGSGTFRLADASSNVTLNGNATAAEVAAGFGTLASVGNAESVSVKAQAGGYRVTFKKLLSGTPVTGFTITPLTGTVAASISQVTLGVVVQDTISGIGAAELYGTTHSDRIDAAGFSGSTTIKGLAGNDTLAGSATGANFIRSGVGNSVITGGAGADTLQAGDGFNTLVYAGAGNITLTDTALLHNGTTSGISGFLAATLSGSGNGTQVIDASGFTGLNPHTPITALYSVPGAGLTTAASGDADVLVTLRSGATLNLYLDTVATVDDVLAALGNYDPTKLTAALDTQGRLVLTDHTAGSGSFSIAAQNGSLAAQQLGLASATASMVGGNPVLTGTALTAARLVLQAGGGADTLIGGAGDDSFIGGDAAALEFRGGAGNDSLRLDFASNLVFGAHSITIGSGTTHTDTLSGGIGAVVLNRGSGAGGLVVNASVYAGAVTVNEARSADTITGGSGALTTNMASAQVFTAHSDGAEVVIKGVGTLTQATIDSNVDWNGHSGKITVKGDDITVGSNIATQGRALTITGDSVTVGAGWRIDTTSTGGAAGVLNLLGHSIIVADGARLIASDGTHADGDITLHAFDGASGTTAIPVVNVTLATATVTVGNATIEGGRIDINTAINTAKLADDGESGTGYENFLKASSIAINWLNNIMPMIGISVAKATSTINVGAHIIASGDVVIAAEVTANVAAAPQAIFGIAAGAAGIDTHSTVNFTGVISAGGDVFITSDVTNVANVDVLAGSTSVTTEKTTDSGNSNAIGLGVVVLLSDNEVNAQGSIVGANLNVVATTVDQPRVQVRSPTGPDGLFATAVAVLVKDTTTNATLGGDATIGTKGVANTGAITVAASEAVKATNLTRLMALPVGGGVSASAGVGKIGTGDFLDDMKSGAKNKAGAALKGTAVVTKIAGFLSGIADTISSKLPASKASPATNNFDLGIALGLAIDLNHVNATVGGGSGSTAIVARGDMTVKATIDNKIKNQAAASVKSEVNSAEEKKAKGSDGKGKVAPAKLGVALGFAVSDYDDQSHATIDGSSSVDVTGKLTVDGESRALIDWTQLWGVNLVSAIPQAMHYDYADDNTDATLKSGTLVYAQHGAKVFGSNSDSPALYKYKGANKSHVDLTKEDFTDDARWENLGSPQVNATQQFLKTVAGYLNDNLGLKGLFNTWSQARSEGAKTGFSASATVLVYNHVSKADIQSGARINQASLDPVTGAITTTGGKQQVVVTAASVTQLLDLTGNFKQPGLKNDFQDTVTSQVNSKKERFDYPSFSSGSENVIGLAAGVYLFSNTTEAKIQDGARVFGDNLAVGAATQTVQIAFAASGGTGTSTKRQFTDKTKPTNTDSVGSSGTAFNGTVLVNTLDDHTTAQIEDGAIITVGSKAITTKLQASDTDADAVQQLAVGTEKSAGILGVPVNYYAHQFETNGASLFVGADDNAWLLELAGAMNEAQGNAIGGSVTVNVVNRDTRALLGDVSGAAGSTLTIKSAGPVGVVAENAGLEMGFAYAGTKLNGPAAASGSPGKVASGGGSGDVAALTNKDGSAASDPSALSNSSGGSNASGVGSATQKAQGTSGGSSGSGGFAVSGSVAVNINDSSVRAVVGGNGSASSLVATGQALTVTATDLTIQVAIAGASASTDKQSGKGIAGAAGVNQTQGDIIAEVRGFGTLTVGATDIEAADTSVMVILSAGLAGASGSSGYAVAGSVAVAQNWQNTSADLSDIGTATVAGDLTVKGKNLTVNVAVAGAVASGGKGGVGAAVAYTDIGNPTTALISNVAHLKRSGNVSVTVENTAVDAVLAVAVGSGTQSFGVAATVAVNFIANTDIALIRNSRLEELSGAAGSVTVSATDSSYLVSLAGAFGKGKDYGLGFALSLNFMANDVRAATEGVVILSASAVTLRATSTAVLVAVGVGFAGGSKIGITGNVAVSRTDNTVKAEAVSYDPGASLAKINSDLTASGDIVIDAVDSNVTVNFAGALGLSEKVGIGMGVAVQITNDKVYARLVGVAGGTAKLTSSAGKVSLTASTSMLDIGVGLGGAAADKFAFGGSVTVTEITNTVEASVTGGAQVHAQGDVLVSATDQTVVVVVAGGFAFGNGIGIGAAVGTVNVQNSFTAKVDGGSVTSDAGAISVVAGYFARDKASSPSAADYGVTNLPTGIADTAEDLLTSGQIVNIVIAGAGAKEFAVGAAISLNWMRNTIHAEVTGGATLTAAGNILVRARDSAGIVDVAIGAAGSTNGAVGAALAYNYIGGAPDTPSRNISANPAADEKGTIQSLADGSTLHSTGGSVQLSAEATSTLVSVTIGAAGSTKVAVAGSFSINFVRYQVIAEARNGATLHAAGDVVVRALMLPTVVVIAGAGAGAGNVAVGVAVATNDIHSDLRAWVEGGTVTSDSGNVTVRAAITGNKAEISDASPSTGTSWLDISSNASTDGTNGGAKVDAQLWSFAITGAGSGSVAVTGSMTLNWIRSTVDAHITSATVTANSGTISVQAADSSSIRSLAGGLAGAGSVSVGAAVAYNRFGNNPDDPASHDVNVVQAYISGGTIRAASVAVLAEASNLIMTGAISGGIAGNVAVNAALALNWSQKTVSAEIRGGADVQVTDNITVDANSASSIEVLAIGLSIALYAGVAGSVAVNTIEDAVDASVLGSGTALVADDNIRISAYSNPGITMIGGAVSAGAVGAGGVVAVNFLGGSSTATIGSGTSVTAKGISGTGIAAKDWYDEAISREITGATVRGLAVIADTYEKVTTAFGNLAVGGLGLGVNTNVVSTYGSTTASIEDASINADATRGQGVAVRAHYNHLESDASVVLAAGGTGIGVAVQSSKLSHTTLAEVKDTTATTTAGTHPLYAGAGLDVKALSYETMAVGLIGIGIGGNALVGSGAGIDSGSTTTARLQAKAVVGSGGVNVLARSKFYAAGASADDFVVTVAVGVGGGAVGAAVWVMHLHRTTEAFIQTGFVDSSGDVTVRATSKEYLGAAIGAGAGGSLAALAGAVSVTDSSSSTHASLGGKVVSHCNITVNADSLTEVNKASGLLVGSLSLGGVGVGASVEVITISQNTLAEIAGNAIVTADGDVAVTATGSRDISSRVFAFGGGLFGGVAGAVSVVAVGDGANAQQMAQADAATTPVNGTFNGNTNVGLGSSGSTNAGGSQVAAAGQSTGSTVTAKLSGNTISYVVAANSRVGGTEAVVGAGAQVTAGATGASHKLDVTATQTDSVVAKTYGIAVGGLGGAAGSITIVTNNGNTTAHVNQAAELWATGAINITATLTDTLEADAYGGAGSLVAALGAQVAVINDHANVGAWLDNGTSTADGVIVHKTSALTITATATHADTEEVFGLSVGSIAGGAAVSDINVDGSTKAYVGNYAQLNAAGALGLLGGVQVHATETVVASNTNTESTGGIGAGTGNRANITMGGEVDAAVGAYATLRSIGAVDIEATFIPQLSTNIRGVSVGGLAVGVSETHVTVSTIVNAALDAFTGSTTGHALVVAGALRVAASVARKPKTGGLEDSVHAYALGASGALIGANGSVVTADWTGPVNAWLGEASSVTINIPASDPGGLTAGSAAVSATTDIRQYGEASSIAAGLIGVGVATATVTTNQNVTAWVGAGSTLTAASLAVAATSKSDNYAKVSAGSGGVVAGGSASATTNDTVNTTARLTGGNATGGASASTITLTGTDGLTLGADSTIMFNGEVSANGGGVIAGNGAYETHTVSGTTLALVGDHVTVTAPSISLTATTRPQKADISGDNMSGTTGGVIAGVGGYVTIGLTLDTKVEVGSHASLTTTTITSEFDSLGLPVLSSGNLTLAALNSIAIQDSMSLTTGGVIGIGTVNSHLGESGSYAQVNAQVLVDANAELSSAGTLSATARGNATVVLAVNVDAYGLVTGAGADSNVYLQVNNTVTFDTSASVTAYGDILVAAGTSSNFEHDAYTVNATVDLFSGSAIPIKDIDANAQLRQANSINVKTGATLLTARDVHLDTDQFGVANMFAQAKSVDWTTGLANAIGGTAGYAGTSESDATASVTVVGTVRTGLGRNKTLVLDNWTDGSTIPQVAATIHASVQDGITYTFGNQLASSGLFAQLATAQQQLAVFGPDRAHSSNATLFDFYTGEIKRITNELVSSGLAAVPTGSTSGALVPIEKRALLVTLDPIYSAAGNIYIRAGDDALTQQATKNGVSVGGLFGTGTFDTPHDVTISIINQTPAFLNIQDITVAPSVGEVRLNGNTVASAASLTFAGSGVVGDILVSIRDELPAPRPGKTYVDPDITVIGKVSLTGTWQVRGDAGYNVNYTVASTGSVSATTFDVNVGGTALIDGTAHLLTPLNGDTFKLWDQYTSGGTVAPDAATLATLQGLLGTPATTPSVYASVIRITAQTIDVNGLIQSGKSSFDLTLGSAQETEISRITQSGVIRLKSVVSDDFAVFYDTSLKRLIVRQLVVKGGDISLDGLVFSTGRGSIQALGGFAAINVTNNTAYDMEVQRLDDSQRGQGSITMTDKSQGWVKGGTVTDLGSHQYAVAVTGWNTGAGGSSTVRVYNAQGAYKGVATLSLPSATSITLSTVVGQQAPFVIAAGDYFSNRTPVTRYVQAADGSITRTYDDGSGPVTGGSTSSYAPASGWRYGWTILQDQKIYQYQTVAKSDWLGIDSFSPDPADVNWGSSENVGLPTPKGDGAYFYLDTGTSAYNTFGTSTSVTAAPVTTVQKEWSTSTWYGENTYYKTYRKETGTQNAYTTTLKATSGIGIGFLGSTSASVTLRSTVAGKDIYLDNGLASASGVTVQSAGAILNGGTPVPLQANTITLTAASSIGASGTGGALQTSLLGHAGSKLAASTTAGDIFIDGLGGPLVLGIVTAGADHDVTLTSTGDVRAAAGSLVTGGQIDINALGGSIGSLATPLQLHDGSAARDKVTLRATASIYAEQPTGDLRLYLADAPNGDVWLRADAGNILDVNTHGTVDPRTETALRDNVWASLGLTLANGFQAKVDNAVATFEQTRSNEYLTYWSERAGAAYALASSADQTLADARTADYQRYWDFRNSASQGGTYNAGSYALSANDTAYYTAVYSSQGFSGAALDGKLADVLTAQKADYAALHAKWGNSRYDATYRYVLDNTGASDATVLAGITISAREEAYYRQLDADAGLSAGDITAHIATLNNKRRAEYAELDARWGSTTYENWYNVASYSGHSDSTYHYTATQAERDAITGSFKVWTANELLNLASAGLLKPVSSTVVVNKDPVVISGGTTTLWASGTVGSYGGQLQLVLPAGNFTDAERTALAAAERTDVSFIAGVTTDSVTASFSGHTITRASGSFSTDGFAVGQRIVIGSAGASASANATDAEHALTITALTATTLTVDRVLATESSASVRIAQDSAVTVTAAFSGHDITRSSGSWVTDGFAAGQQILVGGSSANATDAAHYLTVTGVTASTLTVQLAAGPSATFTVESGISVVIAPVVPDPTLAGVKIGGIIVALRNDVAINSSGTVDVTAGGNAFITTTHALSLQHVQTGGVTWLKSKQGVTMAAGASALVTGNLVVEGGDGGVGASATDPLVLALLSGASVTARAHQGVYLAAPSGDLRIETVFSEVATVDLRAMLGDIYDVLSHPFEKILARDINLVAGGSIGRSGNLLEIALSGGKLDASAAGSVWLRSTSTSSDFKVGHIASSGGDVTLESQEGIVDANALASSPPSDISAAAITLKTDLGGIGAVGADLRIVATGLLTVDSNHDAHISQLLGDLNLFSVGVRTAGETAFIASAGAILNGNNGVGAAGSNVSSGRTRLFAVGDIGAAGKALVSAVGYLEGTSTTGSVYVTNYGALHVGGLGGTYGVSSHGAVVISAHSPIDVTQSVTAETGDITVLTATSVVGDTITVEDGITLWAKAGSVFLAAKDQVEIKSTALIKASDEVHIAADADNSKPSGGTVLVDGTVTAGTLLAILTGDYADTVTLNGTLSAGAAFTIDTGDAADVVALYGSITATGGLTVNTGGGDDSVTVHPALLLGNVAINGGAGADYVLVDRLQSRAGGFVIDGQGDSDVTRVVLSNLDRDGTTQSNYALNVTNSGAPDDGTDQLFVEGRGYTSNADSGLDDSVLVRANFIARLHGNFATRAFTTAVERINYDSSLNGGVRINGWGGNDNFVVDDTSAFLTLDGGDGNDSFQLG